MTPTSRALTRQPLKAGASMSISTSSGSPSCPRVLGTKPKSNGNIMPSGIKSLALNMPLCSSYLYLMRLPFGVSTITFNSPVSSSWLFSSETGVCLCLSLGIGHLTVTLDLACGADGEAVQVDESGHVKSRAGVAACQHKGDGNRACATPVKDERLA